MHDTICALASGPPPSGIAVIRISGPAVKAWTTAHVRGDALTPRQASLRKIVDQDGENVDEALTLFMPAPHSYTGEDVLELNLHGGRAVINHALKTLTCFAGVRLADPGEFTRRAFENGHLDLTQAEGIVDLIEAETRAQKAQALAQKDGALSVRYGAWRDALLTALAMTEVSVDFPDEADAPDHTVEPVRRALVTLSDAIDEALTHGRMHESIREGFKVAILGAPNVGKSTLLNQLAGREAAIVTDIPGTTRDVVEVRCRVGAHIVWFADTAGLRETSDFVEAQGIKRALESAEEADLRIFVFEGDTPPAPPPLKKPPDLWVRNKSDLSVSSGLTPEILSISAKSGDGVDILIGRLSDWLRTVTQDITTPIVTRARHRQGLLRAETCITSAVDLLDRAEGAELVAEEIRRAAQALSALLGEINVEDVLGKVFSEFCIGK